jgi:GT2 family glycosyltransferase
MTTGDQPSPTATGADPAIGVVAIGRNEGERLQRCLRSLGDLVRRTVYVDSGSRDDSVAFARSLGAHVVELDPRQPFTAARARNAGFDALERAGAVEFVQFVDGDCEVEAGWLGRAAAELRAHGDLAVVFGRRRERARDASPYNRLCDLEWDVPVGDALSCGGDALMRAEALRACGGFDPRRIAGEEPELCLRLRAAGWRIRRVDAPMTVHDAAMTRFAQWWRRAVRAGYVEAEGLAEHGRAYPRRRAAYGNLFWAVLVPVAALAAATTAAWFGAPLAVVLVLASAAGLYGLSWLRIARRARARWQPADARLWATLCLLGKWPAVQGMVVYWWRRLRGGRRVLIEYKQEARS